MFLAEGFDAPKDHIDFAFQDTERWTPVGPEEGSPPSQWIRLGDPVSGPAIQIGICPPLDESIWIDTHYHATDQFRCIVSGAFLLQRKRMKAGDFGLHLPGVPYREGPAGESPDPLWIISIHGDWRGARSTITRLDGKMALLVADDQLDRPVDSVDDPYWDGVPGGPRGKAGLAVTAGRSIGGFTWGDFDNRDGWQALLPGVEALFAVIGDINSGPLLMTAHAQGGALLVPALECTAEVAIFVISGSVEIAGKTYGTGEVRIEAASAPLPAITAGAQGADIVFMFADRRGVIATEESTWLATVLATRDALTKAASEVKLPPSLVPQA